MEIVPAILEKEFEELETSVRAMEGIATWVSIDIVDGVFAKPASWPYTHGEELEVINRLSEFETSLNLELHLMVQNPEKDLDRFIDTPAKRILVHYEASANHDQALALLSMSTDECGIVLNLETPIDVLEPYIKYLDFVQLMSISHIGFQGAPFEPKVLEKVAALRKKHPELRIQLDGGITREHLRDIAAAGVHSVAVGSAIFNAHDPAAAYKQFHI